MEPFSPSLTLILPRKPTSIWSAVNINRVAELTEQGLMKPAGLAAFARKKDHKSEVYAFEQGTIALPDALERELKANAEAWAFFQSLPPSAKKQTIWWVISAKQETTRQKRLGALIECSAQGLRIPELRRAKK